MTDADRVSLLASFLIVLVAYRLVLRKLRRQTVLDLPVVGGLLAWALWTLGKLAISSGLWHR
jgi:uncharacterized BrkB/YihY/UPF0761 family membrane protein